MKCKIALLGTVLALSNPAHAGLERVIQLNFVQLSHISDSCRDTAMVKGVLFETLDGEIGISANKAFPGMSTTCIQELIIARDSLFGDDDSELLL